MPEEKIFMQSVDFTLKENLVLVLQTALGPFDFNLSSECYKNDIACALIWGVLAEAV